MNRDRIEAILLELQDYEMGPVPASLIIEALGLLNFKEETKGDTLRITEPSTGVEWLVVLVRPGQRYGRHEAETGQRYFVAREPIVEFWDTRHDHDREHHAQFVSRYFATTIFDCSGGITLDTGSKDWWVGRELVERIQSWLRKVL